MVSPHTMMALCNNTTFGFGNNTTNACIEENPYLVPNIPTSLRDATRAVYICTFLLGVVGNVLVSFILIRKPKPRKGIHIFTLNLSFSDLIVLIVYLPLQMKLFESDMVWSLGEAFCKISYLIIPLSIYASVGTLIAITWDRYMAVVHPLTNIKEGRTKRAILIIWLASFLITMPLSLVSGVNRGFCVEANWPNEKLERAYWILMFLIQCVFPTIFFAVAYTIIIINLKQRGIPLEKSEYARLRLLARKRQHQGIIKLAVVLILVYLICVLPQHIVFFWIFYGNLLSKSYSMYLYLMANLMSIANSAINPIVYGTLNKEIKKGLALIFRCRCLSQEAEHHLPSRGRRARQKLLTQDKSASLLSTRMFSSHKEMNRQGRILAADGCNKGDSNSLTNGNRQGHNCNVLNNNQTEEVKAEQELMIKPVDIYIHTNSTDDEFSDIEEFEDALKNINVDNSERHLPVVSSKYVEHEHMIKKTTKKHGQHLIPIVNNRFLRRSNANTGSKKRVTFSSKEERVTFIPVRTLIHNQDCDESSSLMPSKLDKQSPERNSLDQKKLKS